MKKFEFVFYINGNIVCQRYFSVKSYNKNSLKSMELKTCLDDVVDYIQTHLKNQSVDYLWQQYNPYIKQDVVDSENIYEKEDMFEFTIRVDENDVIKTEFTANVYQQRVRYSVDIRKLVPLIIRTIQETLSKKEYEIVGQ